VTSKGGIQTTYRGVRFRSLGRRHQRRAVEAWDAPMKQRDGETGRFRMTWDGPRLRFTELERSPGPSPQMALAT
jgi:hypothetical protein